MNKNVADFALKFLLIYFVIIWFIRPTMAQSPPAGVLAPRSGGYVFAEHQDAFNTLEPDDLTIEAWFYLTEPPQDEERWIIFAKPGSYEMFIRGREAHNRNIRPEGTVYLDYLITSPVRPGSISRSGAASGFRPGTFPLNRWVHIAIQIRQTGGGTEDFKFFDSHPFGKGFGPEMGHSNTAFLIGGAKQVQISEQFGWGWDYTSLKGWIDEVRIFNTFRYPASSDSREQINPERRFQTDVHTVVLWHFDEGPGALRYVDASGNGYTLFADGTFVAVDTQDKIATTWGAMKAR